MWGTVFFFYYLWEGGINTRRAPFAGGRGLVFADIQVLFNRELVAVFFVGGGRGRLPNFLTRSEIDDFATRRGGDVFFESPERKISPPIRAK